MPEDEKVMSWEQIGSVENGSFNICRKAIPSKEFSMHTTVTGLMNIEVNRGSIWYHVIMGKISDMV